jgi:hypothetical protein
MVRIQLDELDDLWCANYHRLCHVGRSGFEGQAAGDPCVWCVCVCVCV